MRSFVLPMVLVTIVVTGCSSGDNDAATASVDEWCSLSERIADVERDDPDLLAVEGTASVTLDRYGSLLGDAAAVAPDAVLADANTMADGVDRFTRIAADAEFDLNRLGDDEVLDLAAVVLALDAPAERISAFNEDTCGLTVPTTAVSTPTSTTSTSLPSTTVVPTTVVEVTFTGDPDSAWCVGARDVADVVADGFEAMFFAEPAEVEAFMTDTLGRLDALSAVAPSEISDEVTTWLGGLRALDEAFAAAGYDTLSADLSVLEERDDDMTTANGVIDLYNFEVCGIELADDSGTDGDLGEFDPTAGSIRDQAIAEFVAQGFTEEEGGCIFDNIDFSDPTVLNDNAAISEVLVVCGIDFERLMELG